MVKVLCIIENVRKTERIVPLLVGRQDRSRDFCHSDHTCRELLHRFRLASKLCVREDLYFDPAVCTLFHFLGKFFHCDMHRMCFAQTMG